MDKNKQIEVAIRSAQTARSILDLLTCKDRLTAGLMWKQIIDDLEGLRQAVHEAWPA
jgi:hypothetical protein